MSLALKTAARAQLHAALLCVAQGHTGPDRAAAVEAELKGLLEEVLAVWKANPDQKVDVQLSAILKVKAG